MDAITAINTVGAALRAARSFADVLKTGGTKSQAAPQPLLSASESNAFDTALHKAITSFVESRDANGDGKLSRAELGASEPVFAQLDANQDGKIDALELLQTVQRFYTSTASSSGVAGTT